MTVKQLKEKLASIPDDKRVYLWTGQELMQVIGFGQSKNGGQDIDGESVQKDDVIIGNMPSRFIG